MKTPESVTDNNDVRKQSKRGMGWCEKYLRYLAAGKTKISGPALEHCADYINSADDYIQQLESTVSQVSKALCGKENATLEELLQEVSQVKFRLAQTERERDVMRPIFIREMKKYGCTTCEHYIPAAYTQECLGCGNSELKNWVWNGVYPENTKEAASS